MHFRISDTVRSAEFYLPINKREAEAVRAALCVLQHVAGPALRISEPVPVVAAHEPVRNWLTFDEASA